jgi:DNA-binding IclR family transcriptional regulator
MVAVKPSIDTNTVLGKAVSVLLAFTVDDHVLTFTELRRRAGLAKGTLHRVLNDLVGVRLLDRTADGYRLSGQLFELGMRASVERGLLEVATPFMEDLYECTHETVHLGVPEGKEVVYVGKIGGYRQAPAPSRIGGRIPLHCTALGKALLAHSPKELSCAKCSKRRSRAGLRARSPNPAG